MFIAFWTISGRIRKQNRFQSEPRIHFSAESLALLLSECDQTSESAEVSMYKNVCSRVIFNHQKLDCIPLTDDYTLSHRRYSVSWKMILTCWMRNEIVIDYFWGCLVTA